MYADFANTIILDIHKYSSFPKTTKIMESTEVRVSTKKTVHFTESQNST